MKNLKLIICLMLVAALLCACGGSKISAADLTGVWSTTFEDAPEEVTYLLDYVDLYEEERAFVADVKLDAVITVEFGEDGTICFQYDVEANKVCVRAFYEAVINALFENRAALTELYGEEVAAMDLAAFQQFYAEVYGFADYAGFMDELVETVYDYDALGEPIKKGTFKILGETLMITPEGSEEKETIGLKLDGTTLTLTYSDGDEVYTKIS